MMSDAFQLDFRTPWILGAHGAVLQSLLHFVQERQYRTYE
jgi:hypothetical protein